MNYAHLENWKDMKTSAQNSGVRREYIGDRMRDAVDRRLTYCLLYPIFCLLVIQIAHGQPMPLDSVLLVIEKQNPMLQTYRSRVDARQAYVAGSKGIMAPEVGGGLWMFPYQKQDAGMSDPRQIMLSVSQTFTNPAKLKANEKYFGSQASIEQTRERRAFNELRAQAKVAYYRWYVYEQKRAALRESESILTMMIKIAQLRYPYNQSKLSSIYKAEGRLYEIQNMQVMNENEIHHQQTILKQLMNLPHETQIALDSTSIPADVEIMTMDTTLLVTSRSDLRQLDQTIQSMRLSQTLEKAQTKPDFNLSFNHMISLGEGMPNQFMLLGMVTIPIAPWSSKMYKANVQGMNYEIESMKTERLAILNEVQGMTANMIAEIKTLRKQLENYQLRILPALQKNYETLMLAYEENKEELPMVIEGWETVNMTQLQYLDTLARYYEMIVNYEKEIEK